MKIIIFALILFTFISCKPKIFEDTSYDSKSPEYKEIFNEYNLINDTIQSIFENGYGEEYSQENEKSEIISTNSVSECSSQYSVNKGDKNPYAKYFIMRNNNNKILYIRKYRTNGIYGGLDNESQLSYTSYFDNDGNLIGFEKEEYPFISNNNHGNFREISTYFYNKRHVLLKKTFEVSDSCKDCKKNIPIDYEIYMTVDEYLSNNKFKFENDENSKNNSTLTNENENSSENKDSQISTYFKVTKINKLQYIKNEQFEMDLDVINNSKCKFSSVILRADIFYKLKNSDQICQSTVQFDKISPREIKNWEPQTTKHIYFITPSSGEPGGCRTATYDRTPNEITLEIQVERAISVDEELKGVFSRYDLIDVWKDRQVIEGIR